MTSGMCMCDRDVHVIEITGSAKESGVQEGEEAELRVVVRGEARRRRHVVLLLRLHHRRTTYIETERLRGTLDVIVRHSHLLACLLLIIRDDVSFMYVYFVIAKSAK